MAPGLPRLVAGVFASVLLVGLLAFPTRLPHPPIGHPPNDPAGTSAVVVRQPSPVDAVWEKRRWLDKAARLLRGGEGLGPSDDVEALLALPREAAVRRLMDDPRFGDTILDFNLYFLGFKLNSLKNDGVYDRGAFDVPNAVAAAKAMLDGGDYLTLFDLEGPYFMPPLRSTPVDDPPLHPEDGGLSAAQLRAKAVGELRAALRGLVDKGAHARAGDINDYCEAILDVTLHVDRWYERVLRAFDDWESLVLNRGGAIIQPLFVLGAATWKQCYTKTESKPDLDVLRRGVDTALARFERTFGEIARFEPSRYQPQSVREFRALDISAVDNATKWISFGYEQGLALPNSSTNANRRRAAYVLKRFFCDDLTPVGVEPPKQHVKGPIGEPGCQTCHYKLDPMAGFFRNYGAFFYNFSNAPFVAFDDMAYADRQRYISTWQSSDKSKRPWEVGYIRSSTDETRNSYGESVADLSAILRKAPETKQCLMRRLYEYAVAEDQAVDGAWLQDLTRKFEAEAVKNSAEAMREAFVRVVTSQAFFQADADPRRCYDGPASDQVGTAPPCRVAAILEKSCVRCHDRLEAKTGRLDLTRWTPSGAGRPAFAHLDAEGRPLSPAQSLGRVIDRIATNDPELRMPKGKAMSDQDRQELYRWAQEELARSGGAGLRP